MGCESSLDCLGTTEYIYDDESYTQDETWQAQGKDDIQQMCILLQSKGQKKPRNLKLDLLPDKQSLSFYLSDLQKILSQLPNLSAFRIGFKIEDADARSLVDFSQTIQSLSALKQFRLVLEIPQQVSNFQTIMNNLQGYPKFMIGFKLIYSSISNENIVQLHHMLRFYRQLRKIKIDILDSFITDEGISELALMYRNFTYLNQIKLILGQCRNITDRSLEYLAGAFRECKRLQKLELDLSMCYSFTDRGVNNLANGLKYCQTLNYLSLDFIGDAKSHQQLTDKSVIAISNALDGNSSLSTFRILFSSNKNLTNKSLEALGSMIKSLKGSVRSIAIIFTDCTSVDDGGFISVANSLKSTQDLETLELAFQKCTSITDKSLERLMSCTQGLKNLKEVSLYLRECESITQNCIDKVKQVYNQDESYIGFK